MNKANQTIIGWLLLIAGLIIIGMVLYSSFNILTGKKEAPQLFEAPEVSATEDSSEVEQVIQEKLNQALPSEGITKMLNLMSWAILAGIFIFGGGKIPGLGIQLIKD